jgi:hypothetical protein
VWRHLETAQLEQTQPPALTIGAEQLVDAELRPVRIAPRSVSRNRRPRSTRRRAIRTALAGRSISAKAISSS